MHRNFGIFFIRVQENLRTGIKATMQSKKGINSIRKFSVLTLLLMCPRMNDMITR